MTPMRFGLFVPRGWRLDLAGIAEPDQWAAMRDLAQAVDAGPFESIWVYDLPHRSGADAGGHARGLAADGYAIGYFVDAAYDRGTVDLLASTVIPELAG